MSEIEKAIELLGYIRDDKSGLMAGYRGACKLAIQALLEKQERVDPQPLSLEQLRERDGKPVWCEMQPDYYKCGVVGKKRIDEDKQRLVIGFSYGWEWIEDVFRRGKFYDYPPKGAQG
jgi:hypothetical protein